MLACNSYSLPESIKHHKHIDLVLPGVSIEVPVRNAQKRALPAKNIGKAGTGLQKGVTLATESLLKELENCNSQITLPCLEALYKVKVGETKSVKNSYGIGMIFIAVNFT